MEVKDGVTYSQSSTFKMEQAILKVIVDFFQKFSHFRPNPPKYPFKSPVLKTFTRNKHNSYSKTETFILESTSSYPRGGELLLP